MIIGKKDDLAAAMLPNEGIWRVGFQEVFCSNKWIPLCEIEFDPPIPGDNGVNTKISNAFKVRPLLRTVNEEITEISSECKASLAACGVSDQEAPALVRTIETVLVHSLVRCGILRPTLYLDRLNELLGTHGAIIIPDTNSYYSGALHYICRHFRNNIGYIGLPEDVEKEARTHATEFKTKLDTLLKNMRDKATGNAKGQSQSEIVKFREQAQNAIMALRPHYLGVEYELLPIAASSLKSAGGDEEIIRTVSEYLRKRHASAPVFFLTHDYNLARFCEVRRLNVIFCTDPKLVDEHYSVRYDLRSKTLLHVSIIDLLWDLAYAFNTIELKSDTERLTLHSHYGGVSYRNWISELMHFKIERLIPLQETKLIFSTETSVSFDSSHVFETSLPNFLTIAKSLALRETELSQDAIAHKHELGIDKARQIVDLGICLGFWSQQDGEMHLSNELKKFFDKWQEHGVDAVRSWIVIRYPAFQRFTELIAEQKQIPHGDNSVLKAAGLPSRATKYFPKLGELLCISRTIAGQVVWTGNQITPEQFKITLVEYLTNNQSESNVVSMVDIVNHFYYMHHISHVLVEMFLFDVLSAVPPILEPSGAITLDAKRSNSFEILSANPSSAIVQQVNLDDGLLVGDRSIKALGLKG